MLALQGTIRPEEASAVRRACVNRGGRREPPMESVRAQNARNLRNFEKPCHAPASFGHMRGDMTNSAIAQCAADDAALVSASLAGDRDAFGKIVSRYQSLVCSVAYSATGNLTQSEDLAQETFIAAWKSLAGLREPPKLRSWLCGIARNLVHHALRQQHHEPGSGAESLDGIAEPRSDEPLPNERAISHEEAAILWRSLARIPEIYREPLVLYYREHHSTETVAATLGLTDDAVRQRLARGRKMLEAEVLAFVEGSLERTSPGPAFTQSVLGALPSLAAAGKPAALGAVAAKWTLGKGLGSLAWWSSLPMLATVALQWKVGVDDAKSPREKKFMTRTGWVQIAFLFVLWTTAMHWLPKLRARPMAYSMALAGLMLATVFNGVFLLIHVVRRRMQIGTEDGSFEQMVKASEAMRTPAEARKRAFRLTAPYLIMFVVTAYFLPWRLHWGRSALLLAFQGLVAVWCYERFVRLFMRPPQPRAKTGRGFRHPHILFPLMLLGFGLMGGGLGYVLPFFFTAGAQPIAINFNWLGHLGLGLLVAAAAYGVVAFVFLRKPGILGGMVMPLLQSLGGVQAIIGKAYGPIFDQLNLSKQQRSQLQNLMVKKATAGATLGTSLAFGRVSREKCDTLLGAIQQTYKECEAQCRQILGDESFSILQTYEKTIPDRLLIDSFNSKFSRAATALRPDQQSPMLQALCEARQRFPWRTDLSRRDPNIPQLLLLLASENVDAFAQDEKQFCALFAAEAERILDPAQAAAFLAFMETQSKSQLFCMRFTASKVGAAQVGDFPGQ